MTPESEFHAAMAAHFGRDVTVTTPRSTHFIRADVIGEILLGVVIGFALMGSFLFAALAN